MRPLLLALFVLVPILSAQDRDPATMLPPDLPIFLDVRDPARLIEIAVEALGPEVLRELPGDLAGRLDQFRALGLTRLTLGLDLPFPYTSPAWTLLLHSADRTALLERARAWVASRGLPVVELGSYVAIMNSEETFGSLDGVLSGDDEPLAAGRSFAWFEKHAPAADLRLMVDIRELVPIRPTIGAGSPPLTPLLLGHLLHVASVSPLLVGSLTLRDGLHAVFEAPSQPLPAEYGFCAPGGPAPAPVPGPDDTLFRISLRRDIWSWWTRPPEFSSPEQTAVLSRWKAGFERAFPDVSLAAILHGLGDTFDLYGRAGTATPAGDARHALALVTTVRNPGVVEDVARLLLAGLGPRVAAGTARAPALETLALGDLAIRCVVLPGEPSGDGNRDRDVPCVALVRERLIVSTDLAFLRLLATQILDGESGSREPGDRLVIHGPALSGFLERKVGSLPIPAGIPDLDPARMRDLLRRVGSFLGGAGELKLAVLVTDGLARVTLDADIPGWPPAPAAPPPAPSSKRDGR